MILLVLFFLSSLSEVRSQTVAMGLYNEANSHYRDGEFASAIARYERAVESGGINPLLFYNLGNAYFENGNVGKAILWYERAKKLSPRDEDIQANLRFAREVKKDREPDDTGDIERLFGDFFNFPTMNELSLVFSFSWVCLFVIAGWCLWYNRWKGKSTVLLVIFVVLSLFSGGWMLLRIYFLMGEKPAIVMNDVVTARSGPGITQTEVFVVHEGTKVFVKRGENEWVLVRLHNGMGGWVLASQIESI
ncbi:MAG: tetratricopeptide repeat protein [Candidatus Latescibacterota bacterium]|nr:tetratricopeptide repeat protein [Candidatus Latescibacterota bacterium]